MGVSAEESAIFVVMQVVSLPVMLDFLELQIALVVFEFDGWLFFGLRNCGKALSHVKFT